MIMTDKQLLYSPPLSMVVLVPKELMKEGEEEDGAGDRDGTPEVKKVSSPKAVALSVVVAVIVVDVLLLVVVMLRSPGNVPLKPMVHGSMGSKLSP